MYHLLDCEYKTDLFELLYAFLDKRIGLLAFLVASVCCALSMHPLRKTLILLMSVGHEAVLNMVSTGGVQVIVRVVLDSGAVDLSPLL